MVEKFDEFLEEVQQDIQTERYRKLWNKYRVIIISAVVGCLAATAGYTLWHNYTISKANALATQFIKAQQLLSENKTDQALSVLSTLKETSHKGYKTLADVLYSAVQAQDPDIRKASEKNLAYDRIAQDPEYDKMVRGIALLTFISLELDAAEPSRRATFLERLDPLITEDNALRFSAQEMKALILEKQGDVILAAEIFGALARDKSAPPGVVERSQLMAQALSVQLAETQTTTDSFGPEL